MDLPHITDFRSLFLNETPLLDVRAPIEYEQGAFPCSQNLPLMNNDERERIGKQYKELGQDEAVVLGHKLVQGEIKEQRINNWVDFIKQHPKGVLYCFRGGMRSKISQQWIYEKTGIAYPRVEGGYKALRRFLIDELECSTDAINPVILGGRTGIGKTVLLQQLHQQIDLEGILHHRGSVFGKHVTPQPAQIDIENNISIQLLKLTSQQHYNIVFEDEAANIGSRRIPEVLFNKMKQSPLVMLEASVEERIDITFQEYITDALIEHQTQNGEEEGFKSWAEQLKIAVDKIERRLGGVRHKALKHLLNNALAQHQKEDNTNLHKDWIRSLLVDYYDPMYDYQTSKKESRIVFQGPKDDVLAYLKANYSIV